MLAYYKIRGKIFMWPPKWYGGCQEWNIHLRVYGWGSIMITFANHLQKRAAHSCKTAGLRCYNYVEKYYVMVRKDLWLFTLDQAPKSLSTPRKLLRCILKSFVYEISYTLVVDRERICFHLLRNMFYMVVVLIKMRIYLVSNRRQMKSTPFLCHKYLKVQSRKWVNKVACVQPTF